MLLTESGFCKQNVDLLITESGLCEHRLDLADLGLTLSADMRTEQRAGLVGIRFLTMEQAVAFSDVGHVARGANDGVHQA